MFLVNGQKAILRQFNRNENNDIFDDQNYKEITIKCCPFDIEQGVRFGIYTVPEAKGYYQVPRHVDVLEGDQIIFIGNKKINNDETFKGQIHTILDVQDNWIFNRVENKILAVK